VTATVPWSTRAFGFATRLRQTRTVAWRSFLAILSSPGALVVLVPALFLLATGTAMQEHMGTPILPTTQQILAILTNPGDIFLWIAPPFLIVVYAGELVWRERESGLGDIADAVPMPEWVPLAGNLLGLAMMLVLLQTLMLVAGVALQTSLGYHELEIGLYLRTLFGLQLSRYLLFAVLAIAVHVVVNQKYVAHLVVLMAYAFTTFASSIGIEHNMLVYGADPGWDYSDMRGFGPFLAPFAWFTLYWAAWALLLAVGARLLWVRGREASVAARLRTARRRLTRPVLGALVAAIALVMTTGGFVFYNTNVRNEYRSSADRLERRAEYERRYGRYAHLRQPSLAYTTLDVEIHPTQRRATILGSHDLVNRTASPIDTVIVTTIEDVETGALRFDRPATMTKADDEFGHRVYVLARPLQPGDSLQLQFEVRYAPHGFTNGAIDASVVANGSVIPEAWLPAIGYQADRELGEAAERSAHGLAPRPAERSPHDSAARNLHSGSTRIMLETTVSTDDGQTALAPGGLQRTWKQGGRRYFHYVTDVPIRNDYAIYSADYVVHDARWHDVTIQVLHSPRHSVNVERMIRGVQASLEYFTSQFGPYPYHQLRLVERPGDGIVLHSSPVNIWYQEGFALMNPGDDAARFDFPFAVVAHEVAHQWWGNQVTPARVEGAALLSESLAWYAAMGVVEQAHGAPALRRLLVEMRRVYLTPQSRAALPLLRASDYALAYRKGPFAMYALREYVGAERVTAALRQMLARYRSGEPPLPTSLDLYRELQAVTPDSLRPLLADLFERNSYWELQTRAASVEQVGSAHWRVTLDVQARKITVDSAGTERVVPMNDLVEVGVFTGSAHDGTRDGAGEPLYLHLHRIRAGAQRIVVTVPRKPSRAGIDPRNLLIDVAPGDNVKAVTPAASPPPSDDAP
jgi:ABC-type transport system involved in multi-copper enzyme maturation permease subunit